MTSMYAFIAFRAGRRHAASLFTAALLILAAVSCADETEYVTVVLQRPVDMAITCVSSDYSFLDLEKCADTDATAASWVLDGDMGGVFVGNARTGKLIDADPYLPGYSPIHVGDGLTRILASPDSRNVFVAAGIGESGLPELVRIPADFYNVVGVAERDQIVCPIVDMTMVRDETAVDGWFIAAILNCDGEYRLWKYQGWASPADAGPDGYFDEMSIVDLPGTPTMITSGAGRVIVVSRDLPPSDGYAAWDYMLVFDGVGEGDGAFTAVPIVNDSALATDHSAEGKTPDCHGAALPYPGGYVSGRPAVSPDGRFIYVPISVPAGIAVFDGSLNRIDTHAFIEGDTIDSTAAGDTWEFADRFFQYLGYKDIRMDSPAAGVTFVDIPDVGVRALAWLYGGQIVRIIVDPAEGFPWPHRAENDLEDIESSSYQPVLWYQGERLDNGIKTRSDLPSFGSSQVVLPITEEDQYVYYGIQFNGDIEAEAPEVWTATYEGIIPGASGSCGTLAFSNSGGWISEYDLTAVGIDFCGLGIEGAHDGYAGDVVSVTLPADDACGGYSGKTVSFRVRENWRFALALSPLDASAALDPIPEGCGGQYIAWEVRASDQWVVNGARTGFLHPWTGGSGSCVVRDDFDPVFTGRAMTAMPATDDLVVDSCPIARGLDSTIDWDAAWFRNAIFGFWIIPGCRLDDEYRPVVIPPVRDTALRFAMETGRIPNQNDIGGLATSVLVHGGLLFTLDSSNGRVVIVDPADMEIKYSWF